MHWTFNEMIQNWTCQPRDTRVILVRHGQSTFNLQGRHQGSSDDSVLTAVGRSMAHQTGEFLSGVHVDALYTSSLKRAQETAHEILAVMTPAIDPQAIHVVPQLREIDLPLWQGLAHQSVQDQFAADYCCWKQRPQEFRMTTPEGTCFPVLDLYKRTRQFWQAVLPRHLGQTLIVVSHAGTNRALISTALELSPAYYHTLQQSNCGISVLRFPEGDGQPAQLEALNWTGHLGERLPTPKAGEQGLRLLLMPTPVNSKQVQQVTHLLQEPIQFSLCGACPNAAAIAEQILQTHAETVHLQVWCKGFLELWQQALSTRSTRNQSESSLITGLVVAEVDMLQRLVSNVLGLSDPSIDRLHLHPGTVSVLHYATADTQPMLQAINLSNRQAAAPAPVMSLLAA